MTDLAVTPKTPEIFPKPEYDFLVEEAQQSALAWYGRSLPHRIGSYEFLDFVARSWVFARRIFPEAVLRVMKSAPAAMTDGRTIWMPGVYFQEEFYKERADITSAVAAGVMCINGSQIHEALHCSLSTCNLPEWASTNAKSDKYFKAHLGFAIILNLVEDIFIEHYSDVNYPNMTRFLEGKNNILLGAIPAWQSFNVLYSPEANQDHLLLALALLKNKVHRYDDRWAPFLPIKNKMLEAAEMTLAKSDRLQIAIEAWELLMSATDAMGNPLSAGSMAEAGPDTSSPTMGGILSPEELESFLEALSKALEEMEHEAKEAKSEGTDSDSSKADTSESVKGDPKTTSIEKGKIGSSGLAKMDKILHLTKMTMTMNDDEDTLTTMTLKVMVDELLFQRGEGKINLSGIPGIEWRDILSSKETPASIKPSKTFVDLGRLLRYLRQEKHVAGQPRNKGSVLVKHRLHRIVTDGKVLAIRDATHLSKGKPEVIFLLDFSGSMSSGGLISKVAEAGLGAYNSLVTSGISVAVYGHTSSSKSGDYVPLIYGVAAYNMPLLGKGLTVTRNPARAFGMIPKIDHSQNFDGIAIEAVSKRFTKKPGTKLLVVLSDGEPHGGYKYGGRKAFEHTASVIRDVNRSGVAVISLSLVSNVMESNSKLYRKGNLPAYGSLLNKTLEHVVQVVATGQPLS